MGDIVIKASGLGKEYALKSGKSLSLSESLKGLIRKKEKTQDSSFWALKDINFEIQKGEAVGIIGKNGAGKSTLLKILSRITHPTTGSIHVSGRLASLLEVGTGFHPELTGLENIYLNGTILGMKRREIKSKLDEIIAFSGVEKFIDTPVKHYSSGMYVRLAFAVSAHLEPEILVIDEVLAVGDAEFQKKCLGKMEDVTSQGRTVLFVSHNMKSIQRLCDKSIFLENGTLNRMGNTSEIVADYLNNFLQLKNRVERKNQINKPVSLKSVEMIDKDHQVKTIFETNENVGIKISFFINSSVKFSFGIKLFNKEGDVVFASHSEIDNYHINETGLDKSKIVWINKDLLKVGNYSISVSAFKSDPVEIYFYEDNLVGFQTQDTKTVGAYSRFYTEDFVGMVRPILKWENE